MLETDPLTLAKGYVIHKMYSLSYVGGKHTAVENIPKGSPVELRGYMSGAVKSLRREGLLVIHPTGYGDQASATASRKGYEYANIYEKHYNLPMLTYGKPTVQQSKVEALSKEQLHALKRKRSS